MKKLGVAILLVVGACNSAPQKREESKIPVVAFLDLLQDETLAEAKKGFFMALSDSGFRENNQSMQIIYRNAQGDQPTLLQACDYLLSQKPDLIATCPTLATITAVKRTTEVPIFMTVSPRPDLAKLTNEFGRPPRNLFGTYETLEYIDTAVMLIRNILPNAKKIGTIFNQSEPQSVDAMNRIEKVCGMLGLQLEKLPVNNSNEAQLVVQALLRKKIDAFFALPDNTVFAGMEVIVKSCDDAKVPVFTSEEGLVKRGAVAAFGADMYQWGYQSGAQAATFLKTRSTEGLQPEAVLVRRKVFNALKAEEFKLTFDSTYISVK
ncbi:MAG: ABC transporter substrate-binding protein [Bacteroidetes bacterium]|nr:ABC transporter substrate-binding protein [Bacteroidota bacterium]